MASKIMRLKQEAKETKKIMTECKELEKKVFEKMEIKVAVEICERMENILMEA